MKNVIWTLPEPLAFPFRVEMPVLACGAESKNTFCIALGALAFLSPNFGDLEQVENFQDFQGGVTAFQTLLDATPGVIAYDLHPEYLATKYAKTYGASVRIGVQHHHAHIAACIADNEVHQPVIGVAFDGSGYGNDGHIWGGEFMIADYRDFQRVGHFVYIPMPGGSAAIREPWRMAFAYLDHIYGDDAPHLDIEFAKTLDPRQQAILGNMMRQQVNAPLTSSVGRLFDAVSALLGICRYATYEGQAAIEMQANAEQYLQGLTTAETGIMSYEFDILEQQNAPYYLIQPHRLFAEIIADMQNATPIARIAARFHLTVAAMIATMCERLREHFRIGQVALSGGVFQNRLLREHAVRQLQQGGFEVLLPRRLPLHDGNISFGQAVIAAANINGA
ncbi:(NiFe) hydrogenase maturation protein HypF [Candidatus Moduliflexus flocculans]|uniref:Carbamoyltransferase HypF n=1 Tax=Candidatus Moduliflexus flocculans TaxID=1499966 RepID=A0A081BR00_9BACT|nr:(NiFe) hydrogenase maturation protein HypF [Candidatus Moduliflexus flocculans]